MEVTAKLSGAALSAQKARLVADQVRGKPVAEALDLLTFSPKKAAKLVKKVLQSAIANAEENNGMDIDELLGVRGRHVLERGRLNACAASAGVGTRTYGHYEVSCSRSADDDG